MAKKSTSKKPAFENKEFFEAIKLLEAEKGVPAEFLLERVCNAIVTSARRDYGGESIVFCEANPEEYKLRVYVRKNVVDEIENEYTDRAWVLRPIWKDKRLDDLIARLMPIADDALITEVCDD